jgi:hypothetical protein
MMIHNPHTEMVCRKDWPWAMVEAASPVASVPAHCSAEMVAT